MALEHSLHVRPRHRVALRLFLGELLHLCTEGPVVASRIPEQNIQRSIVGPPSAHELLPVQVERGVPPIMPRASVARAALAQVPVPRGTQLPVDAAAHLLGQGAQARALAKAVGIPRKHAALVGGWLPAVMGRHAAARRIAAPQLGE